MQISTFVHFLHKINNYVVIIFHTLSYDWYIDNIYYFETHSGEIHTLLFKINIYNYLLELIIHVSVNILDTQIKGSE